MGLEFVRKILGKPWRKRWAGELDKFKLPDLFDIQMQESKRGLTVDLSPGTKIKTGDACLLECGADKILVCYEGSLIAQIENPPPDIMKAITENCGVAAGIVQHVSIFGDSMELRVQ
jgi:hypothetical protein